MTNLKVLVQAFTNFTCKISAMERVDRGNGSSNTGALHINISLRGTFIKVNVQHPSMFVALINHIITNLLVPICSCLTATKLYDVNKIFKKKKNNNNFLCFSNALSNCTSDPYKLKFLETNQSNQQYVQHLLAQFKNKITASDYGLFRCYNKRL